MFSGSTTSLTATSAMKRKTLESAKKESGFTLVELLVTVSIIGVLAQLSITSFYIYKGKAEFAKAASLYRNARTAEQAGTDDLGSSFTMSYTESTDSGGALAGLLAGLLPGITMPKDVIVGASVDSCSSGGGMDPNLVLVVKPCRGDGKHIEYVRLCNGIDTLDFNAPGNGC